DIYFPAIHTVNYSACLFSWPCELDPAHNSYRHFRIESPYRRQPREQRGPGIYRSLYQNTTGCCLAGYSPAKLYPLQLKRTALSSRKPGRMTANPRLFEFCFPTGTFWLTVTRPRHPKVVAQDNHGGCFPPRRI